jgi:hypothetical protein
MGDLEEAEISEKKRIIKTHELRIGGPERRIRQSKGWWILEKTKLRSGSVS